MKVFAISDLHLSSTVEKPMNIFGSYWDNHFERIRADWNEKVGDGDLVLLGGDMSWGMTIDEAAPDYALVAALKGRKIVVKGNHDLYWNTLGKMQKRFPEFDFLQNNAFRITPQSATTDKNTPETSAKLTENAQSTDDGHSENSDCASGVVIAGSRGWTIPSKDTTEADLKIYKRELVRLELSLKCAQKIRQENDKLIVMLHFPPFDADYADTEMTELINSFNPTAVLYGHLHGRNVRVNQRVIKSGIPYILTSSDLIDFKLIEVCNI